MHARIRRRSGGGTATRLALGASLVVACRAEPPTVTGEHFELTTDLVDEVCAGTVVEVDRQIEAIAEDLGLAPASDPVLIRVFDRGVVSDKCLFNVPSCATTPPREIVISDRGFDLGLRRELVRDRLARSFGSSKPFLIEGTATALSQPSCAPVPTWMPPSVSSTLWAYTATPLDDEQLYEPGELMRWILDHDGAAAALELMARTTRYDTPNEVRLTYAEQFGRSLDGDLHGHWRPADEPLAPERVDCVAPELPRAGDGTGDLRILDASLACDSARVRNDFRTRDQVFVEWTLTVDEDHSGTYYLDGTIPEGFRVTIAPCECRGAIWTEFPPSWPNLALEREVDPVFGKRLEAGTYRVRVYGPIGASIELGLLPSCDYVAQNCPTGTQCSTSGRCQAELPDPGELGDACSPQLGADYQVLPCAAGLTCVGVFEQDGVCVLRCGDLDPSCPAELACDARREVCAAPCDPLAPDCVPGWACVPDLENQNGSCLPFPPVLGELEPCTTWLPQCPSGDVCESIPELEECHDDDDWIPSVGCCTPTCDPAASDPGCPAELPTCETGSPDDLFGACRPG